MSRAHDVLVVGAGLFGLTAALSLRARGWRVTVADPGPVPHPLAASTDVSKVVRADYMDPFYVDLGIKALAGWQTWNAEAAAPLFHRTGAWYLSSRPPGERSFESVARELVESRGQATTGVQDHDRVVDLPAVGARFTHGYHNPAGGWTESGAVIAWLAAKARTAGIEILDKWPVTAILEADGLVVGAAGPGGETRHAASTLVAAGAWTQVLLPQLADRLRPTGHPVFLFRPRDPARFRPPRFGVWTADIENTGWYGFPALEDGRVKVANHGPGRVLGPDAPRKVTDDEETACRDFLRGLLPELADAPLDETRLCLYSDTANSDFLVARDPDRPGLVVAAGGSGHAFKFAPVLGDITADVVEGRDNSYASRFAWEPGESWGTIRGGTLGE